MSRRFAVVIAILITAAATSAARQPGADPIRAGITVMRAINTAENAVKQASGQYLELAELLNHPAMGRVRGDIVVNGGVIAHQGQELRLALNADTMRYQVMVVPAEACGTAVFSNEGGLIYTGKVLDCK